MSDIDHYMYSSVIYVLINMINTCIFDDSNDAQTAYLGKHMTCVILVCRRGLDNYITMSHAEPFITKVGSLGAVLCIGHFCIGRKWNLKFQKLFCNIMFSSLVGNFGNKIDTKNVTCINTLAVRSERRTPGVHQSTMEFGVRIVAGNT